MAIKLSYKLAGIFATGSFILVGLTTYADSVEPSKLIMAFVSSIQYLINYFSGTVESTGMNHLDTSLNNPMRVLQWGAPGAFVGGVIGYYIGDIFSNPKGSQEQRKNAETSKEPIPYASSELEGEALTGNETFLDDIETHEGEHTAEQQDPSSEPK